MKRIIVTLICFITVFHLFSQEKRRIISYNLGSGVIDTLSAVNYDENIISEHTNFYLGKHSNSFSPLDMNIPTDNVYPNSQYTYKQRVDDYYDVNDFPIRTSIELFRIENGISKPKCSGSMISSKHVLTACHCVMDMVKDTLLYDSLSVHPVFNNGNDNINFGHSKVTKIYKLEKWNNVSFHDFALLELEEPLGKQTGWIGIGFTQNDDDLKDKIYYKFSYPGKANFPPFDQYNYNSDTLYFNYGIADVFQPHSIMISSSLAIPGESGSHLIQIENETKYVSYGVLSFASGSNHSRIRNLDYYSIKSIIEPYLASIPKDIINSLSVYPNPATDIIYYELPKTSNVHIRLFNITGKIVYEESRSMIWRNQIDVSSLPPGTYLLSVISDNNKYTSKIIKK